MRTRSRTRALSHNETPSRSTAIPDITAQQTVQQNTPDTAEQAAADSAQPADPNTTDAELAEADQQPVHTPATGSNTVVLGPKDLARGARVKQAFDKDPSDEIKSTLLFIEGLW